MGFLRSNLFIAIVSLFVLTGYAHSLFGDCCAHDQKWQPQSVKTASGKESSSKSDDCKCLCHQIIAPCTVEPVRVASAELVPMDIVAHPDEFPPDAVPLGIEYPPQLAYCLTRIVVP